MNNNLKATGRFSQCNPAIPMAEPACTHSLAFLPLPGNHGTADAETDVEFSVLPDADCKWVALYAGGWQSARAVHHEFRPRTAIMGIVRMSTLLTHNPTKWNAECVKNIIARKESVALRLHWLGTAGGCTHVPQDVQAEHTIRCTAYRPDSSLLSSPSASRWCQ